MGVSTSAAAATVIVASSVYFSSIWATKKVISGVTYAIKKRPKVVVILLNKS